MIELINYIDYLLITVGGYPLVIQVAVFFIVVNSILGIIIYANFAVVRRKKYFRELQIKKNQSQIKTFFLEILNNDHELTELEILEQFQDKVGQPTKRGFRSVVGALEDIITQDRSYRKAVNFNKIINSFKIIDDLESRLDFSDKMTRLRIFQALSHLELTISDSKILPHTYSKDFSMRQESRSSYMGVSKNDPFKFFESAASSKLNDWDQIVLMQQFSLHHKNSLPDFSKWMKYSKEPTQIIFFSKMVAHFDQKNSAPTLEALLDHEDHNVRKEAVLALGRMKYAQVEPKLLEIYHYQPTICQDAIVETILYLQTGKAIDFLKHAYESVTNFKSKMLLAEVLLLYGNKGRNYFEQKLKEEEGFNKLILLHVQNPLIKSGLLVRLQKINNTEKKATIKNKKMENDHFNDFAQGMVV